MSDSVFAGIVFSSIWALLGIIFLLVGFFVNKSRKKKEQNCTSSTYGKVVDLVRRHNYDKDGVDSSTWHPVFEYKIGEQTYRKEYTYGTGQPKYAIGEDVEICFNPENYNEYCVAGDTLPKTLAIIFTCVGVGAIVIAAVALIVVLKVIN